MIERSPLWPGEAAARLDLERAHREVELVVDDDDLLRLDAVAAGQRGHGEPGVVHVGERHGERDPHRADAALAGAGPLLALASA